MATNFFQTAGVAMITMMAAPSVVSVILSITGTVYFLAMLKINVIDVKYKGRWCLFIKSWFKSRL